MTDKKKKELRITYKNVGSIYDYYSKSGTVYQKPKRKTVHFRSPINLKENF